LIRVTIDMPDGVPFNRTLQVRDQLNAGILAAGEDLRETWGDELRVL